MTPVWEGESLQVHHNPAHQWWFAKRMERDDILLLKMYDSESEAEKPGSGIALCTFFITLLFGAHYLILSPTPVFSLVWREREILRMG
jgi:hypothetical protein